METITVSVAYDPPHFNPVAYCNVPGVYRFEADGYEFDTSPGSTWIYADGFSFEEGLEDIKESLRRNVGTGKIRLAGDIPPRSQWGKNVTDGR